MSRPMTESVAMGARAFRWLPSAAYGRVPGRPARDAPVGLLQVREEELDLARTRLGRVGTVDEVLTDLEGEVAAKRAGGGLHRVGDAHQRADGLDGTGTVDGHRDPRPPG